MAKLTSSVRIRATKSGALALAMGQDYGPDESEAVLTDLLAFAVENKVGINAFIPDFDGKKNADGSYSAAQVKKAATDRELALMVSFKGGFPSPYVALFLPKADKPKAAKPAAVNKFARRS